MNHFKLAVLGASGVGKSSFILRFVNNEFNPGCEYFVKCSCKTVDFIEDKFYGLEFLDTFGTDGQTSLDGLEVNDADGILLLFSVTDIRSFVISQRLEYVLTLLSPTPRDGPLDIPIVLVGTKIDLRHRTASLVEAWKMVDTHGIPMVLSSSKTGVGITGAVHTLVRDILKKRNPEAEESKGEEPDDLKPGQCIIGPTQEVVPPEEPRASGSNIGGADDSGEADLREESRSCQRKLKRFCSVS